MSELRANVQSALDSNNRIEREQVRKWIRDAADLPTVALLYRLSAEAWNRIQPILERDETCELICRYYLQCISENPPEGVALRRYEAAGDLEGWLDHLSTLDDSQQNLRDVAAAVTKLYLDSDDDVRIAIETGFLEHVLEQTKFRPLFSHWADDERLRDSWKHALEWGEAHPNYMKRMRDEIRGVQRRSRKGSSES
jgi:hypothetical protein